MAGGFQHQVQAVYFGVSVRGLTRHEEPRRYSGITSLQPFHHVDSRVIGAAHCEQDLESGVLLLEKRSQICLQPLFRSGERLEDTDGWGDTQSRWADAAIAHRGDNCKHLVYQGAGHEGQQRYDKHFTLLYTGKVS